MKRHTLPRVLAHTSNMQDVCVCVCVCVCIILMCTHTPTTRARTLRMPTIPV
jgi:lipoprotein signal peptidase